MRLEDPIFDDLLRFTQEFERRHEFAELPQIEQRITETTDEPLVRPSKETTIGEGIEEISR